MAHQKSQPMLPEKPQWRAWHRRDREYQAPGPPLSETEPFESKQERACAQSQELLQWLNAGGQPDKAYLYDVEIFVGTA